MKKGFTIGVILGVAVAIAVFVYNYFIKEVEAEQDEDIEDEDFGYCEDYMIRKVDYSELSNANADAINYKGGKRKYIKLR